MSYINILNINNLGVGSSFFHKLNPLTKFVILICNYIILANLNLVNSTLYLAVLIIIMLLTFLKLQDFVKILIFLIIPLSGFMLLIVLLNFDHKILSIYGVFIKILSMLLPVIIYSYTTSPRASSYLFYILLKPFERFKINTNLVNLTLGIVISYIPILFLEFDNVLLIKASKGENIKEEPFFKKIVIIYNSLFTVLVNSFIRAERMVEAIIVRGFDKDKKRSFFINYEYDYKDFLVILFMVILTLIIVIR